MSHQFCGLFSYKQKNSLTNLGWLLLSTVTPEESNHRGLGTHLAEDGPELLLAFLLFPQLLRHGEDIQN